MPEVAEKPPEVKETPPPAAPEAKAEPQIDPFVQNILKTVNVVLGEDPKIEEEAYIEEVPLAEQRFNKPPEEKKPEGEEKKEGAPEAKPEEKPEEKKPEEKKPAPVKVTKSIADQLAERERQPTPPPQAPEPKTEEKKEEPKEDEFEKTLSPEQKEELAFCKYAGEKFEEHKNKYEETKTFFKKLDDFISKNSDIDPEGEEMADWLRKNKPGWKENDRRKVERQQIRDEVAADVERRTVERISKLEEATAREAFETKMRPILSERLNTFEEKLATQKLPDGVEAIPAETIQKIRQRVAEVGPEQTIREFPVEGPEVIGANMAAKAFLEMTSGMARFSEQDGTHVFLADFIEREGKSYQKVAPEVGGKKFVTVAEMETLKRKKSPDVGKYYTFDSEDILTMLRVRAHLDAHRRAKEFEAAGFVRQKAKAETKPAEEKKIEENNGSHTLGDSPPKLTTSKSPGAGAGTGSSLSETASFFETLMPGASKIAGAS